MPERLMRPTPDSWKVIWAWTSEWQIHCVMTGGSQQDANTGLKVVHLSAIVDEISRTPVLSNCRTCWMPIWELEWEGRTRLIEVTLLLRCFIQIECGSGGSSGHIVISDSSFIDASFRQKTALGLTWAEKFVASWSTRLLCSACRMTENRPEQKPLLPGTIQTENEFDFLWLYKSPAQQWLLPGMVRRQYPEEIGREERMRP